MAVKDLLNFDQVICGTHRKRQHLNKRIRELLGFGGPLPNAGEKILCLKNDHASGLLNGTLWTVKQATPDGAFVELEIENNLGQPATAVAPTEGFTADKGNGADLPMNPFTFGRTVHKAQGSQWGSVFVDDQSLVFRAGPLALALYGDHSRRETRPGVA